MEALKQTRKMVVSRFDGEQKNFYLKPQNEEAEEQAVSCNIKLQGMVNEQPLQVKTDFPLTNYSVFRFTNPYLNAQNDLFKINYSDKSIGYIIPFSAIEDNNENPEEEFDVYKQAYKYYCVKSIIENHDFDFQPSGGPIHLSNLVDKDSIFVILCKSLIGDATFKIEDCLPSFALRGYYFFPGNTKPNVLSFAAERTTDVDLNNLIDTRFLANRGNASIHIQKSKIAIEQNQLLYLLYTKLLVESNNPLHRFLILYQVIELLVETKIRKGINGVCIEKDKLNNYDFFQKLFEVNNTRSAISSLFDAVVFSEKTEITNALKDFILQTNANYAKQTTGDCFYDIRNLLFHDFKRVIVKKNDGDISGLVLQCEILIHQLIISFIPY